MLGGLGVQKSGDPGRRVSCGSSLVSVSSQSEGCAGSVGGSSLSLPTSESSELRSVDTHFGGRPGPCHFLPYQQKPLGKFGGHFSPKAG